MAEALDLDPTIPVVVSELLMKCHGDRLEGTSFLKGRAVIVQPEHHTLCCKELFLLRPGEFARHWTPGVVARIPAEPFVAVGSRYIYCQRKAGSSVGRTAENNLEIEEIFRSAGFAVVDPASMTFNRQKAIFECRDYRRNQRCGSCKCAFSSRQATHYRRADFIRLDVDNDADDGESLRLRIRGFCRRARGRWPSRVDHGAAGHSQKAHRPSIGWFVNFSVNDV